MFGGGEKGLGAIGKGGNLLDLSSNLWSESSYNPEEKTKRKVINWGKQLQSKVWDLSGRNTRDWFPKATSFRRRERGGV